MNIPDLAGVATADLVERIGTGKFTASYINWARTVELLRKHAPGWLPELVLAPDGYILHQAPVGAYLMIRFRCGDTVTPPVPQAVMDARNGAIPVDKITARDITDTHRRGVCMAAAFTFGLAYELWAKMPLESGHKPDPEPDPEPSGALDWPARVEAMLGAIFAAGTVDALRAIAKETQTAAREAGDREAFDNLRAAAKERAHELEEQDHE